MDFDTLDTLNALRQFMFEAKDADRCGDDDQYRSKIIASRSCAEHLLIVLRRLEDAARKS